MADLKPNFPVSRTNYSKPVSSMEEKSPEKLQEVLQFLQKHGFKEAEAALQKEMGGTLAASDAEMGSRTQSSAFALKTESDVSSLVAAYQTGSGAQDPGRFEPAYELFFKFVSDALDSIKAELGMLLYPVFVHMYLSLVSNGYLSNAKSFISRFGTVQETYWHQDVKQLASITSADQLTSNLWFTNILQNQFNVRLASVVQSRLETFLLTNSVIKNIVEEHLNIETFDGNPRSKTSVDAVVGAALGERLLAVNSSKIFFGLLKDPVPGPSNIEEEPSADKDTGAVATAIPSSGVGGDKDKSTPTSGGSGLKKKKSKKDLQDRKRHRPDPNAPSINRIPLPELSDAMKAEKQTAIREMARRIRVGPEKLPSICLYTIMNANKGVCCCDVSDDTSLLSVGFGSSSVQVWALSQQNKLKPLKKAVDLDNIDKESDDVLQEMIDDKSSAETLTFLAHSGPVYGTSFSPDRSMLLSCSDDETIRLWSLQTWTNLIVYRAEAYPVWDVKFSQHGYYFASGHADSTALLWACDRAQPLRIFADHYADVNCVQWHPNSNYLATGSSDRSVRVFDLLDGHCARHFTGNKGSVTKMAFSPNGRLLVAGDSTGHVTMWDIGSGRMMTNIPAHQSSVAALCFSRDGNVLATGGMDSVVKLLHAVPLMTEIEQTGHLVISADSSSTLATESPNLRTKRGDLEIGAFPTKNTPIVGLHFTRRNLLAGFGVFGN